MTLAQAILNVYDYPGTLESFCAKNKKLKILEINTAGSLTKFFEKMKNHVLAEYPEIDMLHLPYKEGSFDLVLHSDTLEHVELPIKALSECYRVLGKGGFMAYTVPPVVGRRNHRRTKKMKPSYHGAPGDDKGDYIVYTEYGDDLWVEPIMAGFNECRLTTIDYPSSVAISSRKH